MNWHKKGFLIFVICGVFIACIGVYLELKGEKTVFIDTERWTENYLISGWQIILMGLIIIIPGIFLLVKSLKEKD